MKAFFPEKETEHIRQTLPAWPHPGYTHQEMLDVTPGHRVPVTLGDKFAWKFMRFCRYVEGRKGAVSRTSTAPRYRTLR